MFDEKLIKEAIEKARKNVELMGGKKQADIELAEATAALLIRTLKPVVEAAIQRAAILDGVAHMFGIDKRTSEEKYSPDLTTTWLAKAALYIALEAFQHVPNDMPLRRKDGD
jgi:hypothetical protein